MSRKPMLPKMTAEFGPFGLRYPHSKVRAELRAAEAVIRVAHRLADGWERAGMADEGVPDLLVRALARLDRVTGAKGGGR